MADANSALCAKPFDAGHSLDGAIANNLTARISRSSNTRDDFTANDAAADDADADEDCDDARCAMGGLYAGINGAPDITAMGSAAVAPADLVIHVAAALDAGSAGACVEAHSAASRSSRKNSAQLMSRYTRTAAASRDRDRSCGSGALSSFSSPPLLLARFKERFLGRPPLEIPAPSSLSESLSPLLEPSRTLVDAVAAAAAANENRTDRDGVTGPSLEAAAPPLAADDARLGIENSDRMAERGVLVDEEAAAALLLELLLAWLGEDMWSASTGSPDGMEICGCTCCNGRGATDCAAAAIMSKPEDKLNGTAADDADKEEDDAALSAADTAIDEICGERPLPARAAAALAAAANGVALTGERVGLFHMECADADADADADSWVLGMRAWSHSVE